MKNQLITSALRFRRTAFTALAMSAMAVASAHAVPTITNGSFSTSTSETGDANSPNNSPSCQIGANGCSVSGWANVALDSNSPKAYAPVAAGYNFVFVPNNPNGYGTQGNPVAMYGSFQTVWTTPTVSPDGGNFMALDGDYNTGTLDAPGTAIGQTVTGLTVGNKYVISFYDGIAQQAGFTGATTETLQVGFQDLTTPSDDQYTDANTMPLGTQAGAYWAAGVQTVTFTATNTSEVLSFLALGVPSTNQPTFALLDGVSIANFIPPPPGTPEPGSLTLLSTGLLGLAGYMRARYKKAAVSL